MKTIVLTALVVLVLVLLGAAGMMFFGAANVAATSEPPPFMRWALATTRERAVELQARQIAVPDLSGEQMIDNGFRGYRDMCATCHTPPGQDPSPIAQGLNPQPPDLAEIDGARSAAEMFWVIKHGIQMTGMPAWGPTHSDQEIWELVAFLRKLPSLNATGYAAMDARLEAGHGHGGDGHHGGHGHVAEHPNQEAEPMPEGMPGSRDDHHAPDHGAHDHAH